MLKLSSLAQKIGKLLTALHHNGRLSPHRGNVPPATAVFNGENIRDNSAVTRPGSTGCQPQHHPDAVTRLGSAKHATVTRPTAPAFTDTERSALTGFLAGYSGPDQPGLRTGMAGVRIFVVTAGS